MTIQDKRLDEIVFDKQKLVIQLDRGLIEQEKYDTEMKVLNDKGNALQKELLAKFKEESKDKDVELEKIKFNMRVKKTNPSSYTSLIINALMGMGKNINEVVDTVNGIKPGRDKEKIKAQTRSIIRLVIKQEGRWAQYKWDQETFILSLKE